MGAFDIADRRAVMNAVELDPGLRTLLMSDPGRAITQITGRRLTGKKLTMLEEGSGGWDFVIPSAGIETQLPSPTDARGMIENEVYAILRDEPSARAEIIADPCSFLRERLDFELGDSTVRVHEERAGELLIVLPLADARDELPDAMLDLVSAGGDNGCQNANNGGGRTTPRPWNSGSP